MIPDSDIRSIQIVFSDHKIVAGVAAADGGVEYREYFGRAEYLLDFPDRPADCDAIGWPPEST